MWVKSLNINNLRNIVSSQIEPDPCLNCFIGENGAGKTSILESLVVLSKGRSFRTGQLSSLIRAGCSEFQIIGGIETQNGDSHHLGMERSAENWVARHNKQDVNQISELTRLVPYVLLEPNSHTLVSGPPDGRRKYMDWGVFHVEHAFLPLWRKYSRVLKQRNAALRQSNLSVVESLDPQFIDFGEQIHQARERYALSLNVIFEKYLPEFSQLLTGISVSYLKGWSGDSLSESINSSRLRDTERGATGPGPHKADLYLSLDGVPAKERLSRGEQKVLTAAMIMAQAKMICESGERPLLLLDDVASELDKIHLDRVLTAAIELEVQIWLTGTVLSPVIDTCSGRKAVFHVKQGAVHTEP